MMPEVVNEPTVQIATPSGVQSVDNPLLTYNFHPLNQTLFPPSDGEIATYNHTVRSPDLPGGNSDPVAANNALLVDGQGTVRQDTVSCIEIVLG